MNILMLSIGPDCAKGEYNEQVRRHLDYAKTAKAQIYMVTYAPNLPATQESIYEQLFFVYTAGASNQLHYPFKAYQKALNLAQKVKFDLIYTQDPFGTALVGVWLRKKWGIPLIIGSHSSFIDNQYWIKEKPLTFRLFNQLGKYLIGKADALKVTSASEKHKYINLLKIPESKIYVQNTPVNVKSFSNVHPEEALLALRASLQLEPSTPLLLWVGRPVKVKRLNILLEVFAKVKLAIPGTKLLLIGKKNLVQENYDPLIENLSLGSDLIWLTQGVPNDQISKYYQIANVYCHTSCYESLCKATLEAAASGLPVVTTNTAGSEEVVQHAETGYIADIDAVDQLVAYLTDLLLDPAKAQKFGLNGQKKVLQTFDYDQGVKHLTDKWKEIAGLQK